MGLFRLLLLQLKRTHQWSLSVPKMCACIYLLTALWGGHVVPGHTLKILSIRLMTPQQADNQGAESGAYTATKMVFVVNMEGPFYATNVKSPISGSADLTRLSGYEFFVAHSGDMLVWGCPLT